MLSRKPTAIKLTYEDIQELDNVIAQQKASSQDRETSSQPRKTQKGKEVASSAQERQQAMDERIGVSALAARTPR